MKDFNIIKTFLKEKKSLYRDIYCYRDIKFVISWYKILVISPTPNDKDPSCKADLPTAIQQIWNQLDEVYCFSLVTSMPQIIQAA